MKICLEINKFLSSANGQKVEFFDGISKIINPTLLLHVMEVVLYKIVDLKVPIKLFSKCLSVRENLFRNQQIFIFGEWLKSSIFIEKICLSKFQLWQMVRSSVF